MRKMHPYFVMAALTFFSQPKRAIRDGEGRLHAPVLAIQVQSTVVSGSRIRQPIHLVRFPVPTTVWGRGGIGKFVFAKTSSIMLMR